MKIELVARLKLSKSDIPAVVRRSVPSLREAQRLLGVYAERADTISVQVEVNRDE